VNEGAVADDGRKEELMEQHGLYRALYERQSGERRAPKAAPDPPRELQQDAQPEVPEVRIEVQSEAQPARAPSDEELTWTGSGLATRPKVVVLGMMTKIPVAGVVWQTMHYLVGLERLGFDAYYVEAHARTPSMFVHAPHEDVADTAAAFIAATMRLFGLEHRWAF